MLLLVFMNRSFSHKKGRLSLIEALLNTIKYNCTVVNIITK